MRKFICGFTLLSALLLAACTTATTPVPTALPSGQPTITSPTGYRPVQSGDTIEGESIGYQYVLPSLEQPVVTIAASPFLQHFVAINPDLNDGLLAFIRELPGDKKIYAFEEANPRQTTPQLVSWDATKPVEIVYIGLPRDKRDWSVTEEQDNQIEAAYKIVRRKDGGLRFIDAYGRNALFYSGAVWTTNGTGIGLMLSSRLALLKMILNDQRYQTGKDVMQNYPPAYSQYDPRVLRIDPSKEGLSMNQDWALITFPGPNSGLPASP
jgi:hypothetical protein